MKIPERYGMNDCKLDKIPISPRVANFLIAYKYQAAKGTVALYQSAV